MNQLPPPVRLARRELADREGLSTEQVSVVEWKAVEWRDASLGCPQPGMLYAQVITPGYLVRLEAGGRTFEVHTDLGQRTVTCSEPQPPLRSE